MSRWRVFGELLATSPRHHAIVAARAKKALDVDTVPQLELFDVRHAKPVKPCGPAAEKTAPMLIAPRCLLPRRQPVPRSRGARNGERALRRLCVKPDEAAQILGISRDFFDEHIKPELRIIRRGSKTILIPVLELERWVEQSAARWIA
jgi:hypothetical protein